MDKRKVSIYLGEHENILSALSKINPILESTTKTFCIKRIREAWVKFIDDPIEIYDGDKKTTVWRGWQLLIWFDPDENSPVWKRFNEKQLSKTE